MQIAGLEFFFAKYFENKFGKTIQMHSFAISNLSSDEKRSTLVL